MGDWFTERSYPPERLHGEDAPECFGIGSGRVRVPDVEDNCLAPWQELGQEVSILLPRPESSDVLGRAPLSGYPAQTLSPGPEDDAPVRSPRESHDHQVLQVADHLGRPARKAHLLQLTASFGRGGKAYPLSVGGEEGDARPFRAGQGRGLGPVEPTMIDSPVLSL